MRDAILTKPKHFALMREVAPQARLCTSLDEIVDGGDHLLSYGHSIIIPGDILNRWHWCYNVHGAPPSHPGRDCHHWAAYAGTRVYGATAHVMTELVDDGPIVGTLLHGVPRDCTPAMYLRYGERAAELLLRQLAPLMFDCGVPSTGEKWSGIKRSREDLLRLLDTEPMHELDALLREHAFGSFKRLSKEV